MTTNFDWAAAVLRCVPLPQSANNVDNVVRWMAAEEPPSFWWHANDPLNVNNLSQGGQESFPSLADGIVATAAVLRQSNMRGIYDVLAADGPLSAFGAGTGHPTVPSTPYSTHTGGRNEAVLRNQLSRHRVRHRCRPVLENGHP